MALSASIGDQIVAGLADPRENLRCVLEEIGLPLVGFAAHEAVEIVEAHADRPLIEGAAAVYWKPAYCAPCRTTTWHSRSRLQDPADRGVVRQGSSRSPDSPVACSVITPKPTMVIASGDQRGARRRAQRGGMELR